MRQLFYIFALLIVIGTGIGCAADKKAKTPREEAKLQWNQARASVLISLANDQYAMGNLDKCEETIGQALKMDPTSPQLHLLQAKLSIEKSELESAQRSLDLVRKLDEKNAEADYLSGVIYQRWQRTESSLTYYTSATEKAPAELPYLLARAEMLVVLNRQAEALTLLQAKVQYFEHSATIRDAVGQLLVQAGRFEEAIETFRQAAILAEDDMTVREHLALALFQNKQYRDSADVLFRLVKHEAYTQRSDLMAALGECQLQIGKLRDARASFESAAQINGGSPEIWLGLAKAALQLGDLHRADMALKKARSLDPRSSEVFLMLGYIRLKQDKLADSLAAFKQAFELDQKDTVSLCMVGYVLEKSGQSEAALNCYARALQIKPNDEMASRLMAAIEVQE